MNETHLSLASLKASCILAGPSLLQHRAVSEYVCVCMCVAKPGEEVGGGE